MHKRKPITREFLQQHLIYYPETGLFRWRKRRFKVNCGWNTKNAGQIAGSTCPAGYVLISLGKERFLAHRLAFVMMTGTAPICVDHINGVRHDNRWSNLRSATRSQNNKNKGVRSDNSSGATGVSWHCQRKRWVAEITCEKKHKFLGLFDTIAEASAAYKKAAEQLYGEFHRRSEAEKPTAAPPMQFELPL